MVTRNAWLFLMDHTEECIKRLRGEYMRLGTYHIGGSMDQIHDFINTTARNDAKIDNQALKIKGEILEATPCNYKMVIFPPLAPRVWCRCGGVKDDSEESRLLRLSSLLENYRFGVLTGIRKNLTIKWCWMDVFLTALEFEHVGGMSIPSRYAGVIAARHYNSRR